MALNFLNLDDEARAFMVEEIELDAGQDKIYLSNWLTEQGKHNWTTLLLDAAKGGTDDTLGDALVANGCIRSHSERKTKNGVSMVQVPYTAKFTMSEGEFNRYYVRGVCRRAIAAGIPTVIVYRAKAVENPRPGSQEKIGASYDPAVILEDLRQTQGLEPALGLPPGPNSGLSIRLP